MAAGSGWGGSHGCCLHRFDEIEVQAAQRCAQKADPENDLVSGGERQMFEQVTRLPGRRANKVQRQGTLRTGHVRAPFGRTRQLQTGRCKSDRERRERDGHQ